MEKVYNTLKETQVTHTKVNNIALKLPEYIIRQKNHEVRYLLSLRCRTYRSVKPFFFGKRELFSGFFCPRRSRALNSLWQNKSIFKYRSFIHTFVWITNPTNYHSVTILLVGRGEKGASRKDGCSQFTSGLIHRS